MEVGVHGPEQPAREDVRAVGDRQRDPERDREREPPERERDPAGGEGPAGQPSHAQSHVDHVGEDPGPHQCGRPREAVPATDPEVADHPEDPCREPGELPARQALAPKRALDHDGDQLVARAHDGQRDPAQRDDVREGQEARVVVVARPAPRPAPGARGRPGRRRPPPSPGRRAAASPTGCGPDARPAGIMPRDHSARSRSGRARARARRSRADSRAPRAAGTGRPAAGDGGPRGAGRAPGPRPPRGRAPSAAAARGPARPAGRSSRRPAGRSPAEPTAVARDGGAPAGSAAAASR